MTRLACIFLSLCLLLPSAARGNSADVMMLPVRVVMEGNDLYNTIVVKNTGNAAGDYTVDLVDMKMLETGLIVPLDPGESPAYSALPYLHIAPRSMTIKPGETENIRLALRKPENLEPGEYRAHVRVRLVNANTDPLTDTAVPNNAVITVRPKVSVLIPVIVRTGVLSLTMDIQHLNLSHESGGAPVLEMYLMREGNRSSMGDLTVTWYPRNGSAQVIGVFRGIAVYRPTPGRFVSLLLDRLPKGSNLSDGKIRVLYTAPSREGGKQLASAELSL